MTTPQPPSEPRPSPESLQALVVIPCGCAGFDPTMQFRMRILMRRIHQELCLITNSHRINGITSIAYAADTLSAKEAALIITEESFANPIECEEKDLLDHDRVAQISKGSLQGITAPGAQILILCVKYHRDLTIKALAACGIERPIGDFPQTLAGAASIIIPAAEGIEHAAWDVP